MYEMYKKAVASFWSVEEVDLSQDTRDWISLSGLPTPSNLIVLHVETILWIQLLIGSLLSYRSFPAPANARHN